MKHKFTNFEALNYTGFKRIKNAKTGAKGYIYINIRPDAATLKKLSTAANVTFSNVGYKYAPEMNFNSVILWDKCI